MFSSVKCMHRKSLSVRWGSLRHSLAPCRLGRGNPSPHPSSSTHSASRPRPTAPSLLGPLHWKFLATPMRCTASRNELQHLCFVLFVKSSRKTSLNCVWHPTNNTSTHNVQTCGATYVRQIDIIALHNSGDYRKMINSNTKRSRLHKCWRWKCMSLEMSGGNVRGKIPGECPDPVE